jgi:SAM-dependent methyltransferase
MAARLPPGTAYLGVDVSEAELALATTSGRGPVLRADMRDLPLADGSFDVVVSSMGIMLVRPLDRVFTELARVLRPGGTLAFLVPSAWPLRRSDLRPLLTVIGPLHGPGSMPQHVSPHRARRLLARSGLEVTDVSASRFPFPLRTATDAHLAVQSLYTPRRTPEELNSAVRALSKRVPAAELPVPLRRVVARRADAGS